MFRAAIYFLVYHNTNLHNVTIQSMRTPAPFFRNKYVQREDESHAWYQRFTEDLRIAGH